MACEETLEEELLIVNEMRKLHPDPVSAPHNIVRFAILRM
jgi:hypothetical protein